MIKVLARAAAGLGAAATGVLARHERAQRSGLTVLCYHRVLPASQRAQYHDSDLVVTPEAFDAHCAFLAKRFRVLPMAEALVALEHGNQEKPLAAITFDDGYRDNYIHALPILRRHGLRATFFVIAGLVDTQELPWYDTAGIALQRLNHPNIKGEIAGAKLFTPGERKGWFEGLCARARDCSHGPEDEIMTGDELRTLAGEGHEIGSHSMTHPILPQCVSGELPRELQESRERLQQITGDAVQGFCYPNGDYGPREQQALRDAGYRYACTMDDGVHSTVIDAFAVRRWFVQQERLAGVSGAQSLLAMRMEWSGAAETLYRRRQS